MKDETKEILNKLLEYFKESNINHFGYEQDKLISYEEAQILLDYITNLQEENKELKLVNNWSKRDLYKANRDRLEANQKLQKNLDFMIDRNGEKQDRIDKANEFIKEHTNNFAEYLDVYEAKELSNILKGENDDRRNME